MINRELSARIVRLYTQEQWKVHTISTQLHVHHTTVENALRDGGVERPVSQRPSLADPFIPFIKESLAAYPGLCASRLLSMVKQRGYPGESDGHFRKIVARYRPRPQAQAYLRVQTLPGEQAQVDWAHFGKHTVGGTVRNLSAFVMVLSYSRMLFVRFFLGQTQPLFLQGHLHAFDFFAGVPRTLLYDNLKSAVLERVGGAIRFHPTLWDFASHYGYEPRPVAVARGNQKGRVERAIRYLRTSFFPARTWKDLADLNAQALAFCRTEAARRKCPDDATLTVEAAWQREQPLLLPLPPVPYPTEERIEVRVGKTPYVRFDRNDYSVPHSAVRRTLTVLASDDSVRICEGDAVLAVHQRCMAQGQTIEDAAHIEALRKDKHQAREPATLRRLTVAAPAAYEFLRRLAARGGAMGPTIARLGRLLDLFGAAELQAALEAAATHPSPDVHAVHLLLDQRKRQLSLPPPIGVHLAHDSPLRTLTVTPHALSSYDTLAQEDPDDGI